MEKNILINFKEYDNGDLYWDMIPNWLWRSILYFCKEIEIDRIAFEHTVNVEDIKPEELKRYLKPVSLTNYLPYHGTVNNIDEVEVCQFEYSYNLINYLKNISINRFAIDLEYPYDEIIFFKNHIQKVLIVPYDGIIFLQNFELEELEYLEASIPKLKNSIYDS